MSRKRCRRANFTAVQKVAIVREHLVEGVPISDLCDRHGLKPNQRHLPPDHIPELGELVERGLPEGAPRPAITSRVILSHSAKGKTLTQ